MFRNRPYCCGALRGTYLPVSPVVVSSGRSEGVARKGTRDDLERIRIFGFGHRMPRPFQTSSGMKPIVPRPRATGPVTPNAPAP